MRWIGAVSLIALATPLLGSDEPAPSLEARCRAEIVELHEWIEAWSNAELPDDDEAFERFSSALDPSFVIVGPDGEAGDRDAVVAALRRGYGRWREAPGRIRIDNVRLLHSGGGFALATYEEWHDLAETRGRISTVLFAETDTVANGLVWRHLHETWLPAPDAP